MEAAPSFQKKKRVNEFEQNNKILKMYPISENNQIIDFCTIDIEAQDWINYVVGGIYDGEKFYHTPDLTKLIDDCFEVGMPRGIKTFWAHFGGKYDFNFFLQVTLTDKRFIVEEIIPRGSGILSFKVRYSVEHTNVSDDMLKHEIIFRDSSALLPFSLKMLTKSFKVDSLKGYIDYQFIRHAWENMDYTSILLGKELEERIEKYEGKLLRSNEPVCYRFFYDGNEINYYDFKNLKNYDPRKTEYQYLKDNDPEYKHKIYGREDLLNYLEDDLKGLYQVLKKFYEWPLIKKAGPAFTMAGQAVKVLRTYLKKPLYSIPKNSENVEDFVRQSYFGGRTEVFRPVFQSRNENDYLYCFDVNSLYPTVMQRYMYPNLFKKWAYSRKEFDTEEFGFWEAEVDVPKEMYAPPLGTYHSFDSGSKKFIFPTGRFKGIWTSLELKYAESIGVKIINLKKGAIFHNGHYIFKDFIDDLYARRLLAKKEKDSVSDLMTKLLMNSCYGRFGMNLEKENLVVDTGDMGLNPHCEIPLENGEVIRLANKKITMESTFTNVAIASWVTAHARVMMHKEFRKLGDEHLFYTDTDSIFTDKMLPSGDALGEMKLEYKAKSAVFLLPKTYIVDEIEGEKYTKKLTMKGFDKKKIQHFTPEDFMSYLEGEVRYLSGEIDKIETNITVDQSPRFATFKTALQKGMFVCMNNDPETDRIVDTKREEMYFKKTGKYKRFVKKEYKMSERSLKAVYDKRILTDNGFDSKPFHLGG